MSILNSFSIPVYGSAGNLFAGLHFFSGILLFQSVYGVEGSKKKIRCKFWGVAKTLAPMDE